MEPTGNLTWLNQAGDKKEQQDKISIQALLKSGLVWSYYQIAINVSWLDF